MSEPLRELPRSARRVREALVAAGVQVHIRELDTSTRTAPEAAAAVGCELGAIVKTLVFRGERSGDPLLALVSGVNRADEAALADGFGERAVRADAEFVRAATGFAIGGVPPVGHPARLRALLDEDLLRFEQVWCAAGTPRTLFPLAPADLRELTGAAVARLAAQV